MITSLKAAPWLSLASAACTIIFLCLLPFSLHSLYHSKTRVHSSWKSKVKLCGFFLYALLQFTLFVWRLVIGSPSVPIAVIALVTSSDLVASLGLLWLSTWAHWRSLQPSNLVITYLLAKFACFIVWFTAPESLLGKDKASFAVAKGFFLLILLLLECQSKRDILLDAYKSEPPEATTSFVGRVLFLWINPILVEGYYKIFLGNDLPPLDRNISSKHIRRAILRAWDRRGKPEDGTTLPRVLLKCFQKPFIGAIIPRVFVIVFRFAQPLLISRAIRFVTSPYAEDERLDGYWIIVAATVIYVGMAVSTSAYQHRLNRLEVMIRGAMVNLLHNRALNARDGESEDGRVATLLSNDIPNVEQSAQTFHETWAQFVEVIVGTVLLAREVGWLWPVPLVFIYLCSYMSRYVANNLKARQGKWNVATQQRISVTSSMLASIKSIKMLGIQPVMADYIEDLRRQEMNAARGVRWLMTAYNASANALGMFAPVLTIILYAGLEMLRERVLDVETAFTTVAILSMVTHPANMVMTYVPRAVVSYASFERIHEYLLDKQWSSRAASISDPSREGATTAPVVRLEDVTIVGAEEAKPILQDVNLQIRKGTIVICTGPVGSGKTVLARAILGDLSISRGNISLSHQRVSYCAQTPWLPNQTVREVICGPAADHESHDEVWYQSTIKACCLDSDLELLPQGDGTMVGSRGMNLSGGQQQRVALARAVYSRCEIAILDDSLSALDRKTQDQVVQNLLGPNGLFRKHRVAVLWITTATRHFDLADEVIVLADGTIKERGTWEQLRKESLHIDEIIHSQRGEVLERAVKVPQDNAVVRDSRSTMNDEAIQELSRKNGDLSLYGYYFTSAGIANIVTLVLCTATYSFFFTIPQYWLRRWTESSTSPTSTRGTVLYMTVYVLLLLIAWLITNGMAYTTSLLVAETSGLNLHRRLLAAVASAPLLYFSRRDAGAVLNRFGQDIQLVDKQLAQAASSASVQAFKLLAQASLLCASLPAVAASVPPAAAAVYAVQRLYLRTSRQLRLLELEARAAVVSALLEAAQGAATVRAFGWRAVVAGSVLPLALDASQAPMYLLACLQRWLGVVLELLVAAVAVASVWLAVAYRGSTTGGQIGVALNMILVANDTLLKLVRAWTDLEVSLGAVARLRDVETRTPREDGPGSSESAPPPDGWPTRGRIEFTGVTAAYNPKAVALRDLGLTVEPGQTAVVCGRTGSGKSSMLLTLLKLVDTTEGTITIDGADIAPLPKATIRQHAFITVAQDAFFLPQATLRFNLDPELTARPSVLLAALRRTGLWEHLVAGTRSGDDNGNDNGVHADEDLAAEQTTERGDEVLEKPFSSLPMLSAGQTQLLALARALVRRSVLCDPSSSAVLPYSDSVRAGARPIVLLDEVTSSLDPVTESRIYDIISEEFVHNGHTVVMVTHKLDAIRGMLRTGKDVIVRMAEGKIERVEVVGTGE